MPEPAAPPQPAPNAAGAEDGAGAEGAAGAGGVAGAAGGATGGRPGGVDAYGDGAAPDGAAADILGEPAPDAGAVARRGGLPRVPTGVGGLDHLLMGGLVAGRTTLVVGSSGSGKTLLSSQILHNATAAGVPSVFVSFEERAADVIRNVATMGWDFAAASDSGVLQIVDASPDPGTVVAGGGYDLSGIILQVRAAVAENDAELVVLDSLGGLFSQYDDAGVLRRELVRLRNVLQELGCTGMMTAERTEEHGSISKHGVEDFVADCVIVLRQELIAERVRRTAQVYKLRGDRHHHGGFPFAIEVPEGIVVLPLSAAQLSQSSSDERIAFGNEAFDKMAGGGLFRDSIVLATGPTGGGKTLLCTTFAAHGCKTGDRSLYLGYEESRSQLGRNARNWGYDFDRWEADGLLRVRCGYPEGRSLEGHLLEIRRQIENFRPSRVVIDSISALERTATPRTFREFLIGLSSYLKRERICTVLTSTSPHMGGRPGKTGADISTLTDAIILLRYLDIDDELGRGLTIIKMRGSQHEKRVRRFRIDDAGLHLGGTVQDVRDMVAGLPG